MEEAHDLVARAHGQNGRRLSTRQVAEHLVWNLQPAGLLQIDKSEHSPLGSRPFVYGVFGGQPGKIPARFELLIDLLCGAVLFDQNARHLALAVQAAVSEIGADLLRGNLHVGCQYEPAIGVDQVLTPVGHHLGLYHLGGIQSPLFGLQYEQVLGQQTAQVALPHSVSLPREAQGLGHLEDEIAHLGRRDGSRINARHYPGFEGDLRIRRTRREAPDKGQLASLLSTGFSVSHVFYQYTTAIGPSRSARPLPASTATR